MALRGHLSSVLLELGVGGNLRQKMSGLSVVWANRGRASLWCSRGSAGKRFGTAPGQGVA